VKKKITSFLLSLKVISLFVSSSFKLFGNSVLYSLFNSGLSFGSIEFGVSQPFLALRVFIYNRFLIGFGNGLSDGLLLLYLYSSGSFSDF